MYLVKFMKLLMQIICISAFRFSPFFFKKFQFFGELEREEKRFAIGQFQ